MWVQRVLYNRAVLYGYQQEFAAAEADLREAAQLCASSSWTCRWGSCTKISAGSMACAVTCQPHCTTSTWLNSAFARTAHPWASCSLTGASCYCRCVCCPRLCRRLEEAVLELAQQRRNIGVAEVRLLLAQVAILDGQASLGLEQARTAVREFDRQGRSRWVTLARFTVLGPGWPQASSLVQAPA